ncbi:MAG: TIR domain-containing protein [Bacteroidota bacterium]
MSKQPIKVFISYAHADESYKDDLNIYLTPYERKEMIKIWDDRDILPGQVWDNEINNALYEADVVLFLVSPHFMASGYIDGVELKHAMKLHDEKSLVLIPIIIRPSDMSMLDLRRFQAVPKNAKPISTWENSDEAWLDVTSQLGRVFRKLHSGEFKLNKNNASENKAVVEEKDNSYTLEQIQADIGGAKLDKAIKEMLKVTSGKLPDLHNQIIMQSARLNQLKQSELSGIIGFQQANMTRAQITNALLLILGDIRDELA